jgi:hypothetical protein
MALKPQSAEPLDRWLITPGIQTEAAQIIIATQIQIPNLIKQLMISKMLAVDRFF